MNVTATHHQCISVWIIVEDRITSLGATPLVQLPTTIPEEDALWCNAAMSISVWHMNQLSFASSPPLLGFSTGSVPLLWLSGVQARSHFSCLPSGLWEGSHMSFLLISATSLFPYAPFFTQSPWSQGWKGWHRKLTFDTERKKRANKDEFRRIAQWGQA